jgi:hypothetical protein
MLIVSVPAEEKRGTVWINGEEAQFRVMPGVFMFRYNDSDKWDRRKIFLQTTGMLQVRGDKSGVPRECITYHCTAADGSADNTFIFTG